MANPNDPEPSPLEVRQVDGVLTLTMNRPAVKNALDATQWRRLASALGDAAYDTSVRAVVLTGANGVFSSGGQLGADGPAHPLDRMRIISEAAVTLHDFPKPTIAKVPGPAIGGGWNLALCCDFVICSSNATFAQVFPRRGLSLDVGGSWLLPRLIGMQKAKLLTMTGDVLSAAEVEQLGLATRVVEPEDLDSVVESLAERLAAGPPTALSLTKSLLHRAATTDFASSLEAEAVAQAVNFASEDIRIGLEAFKARTAPSFTGRWRFE
ncbi:enoyl-CoA hydratase/isomerase family protein [Geodermatophilus sabuli]|uniref:2-(1,2-epoxy-1,2-dihydrophenyl)acetyl-CoA isomerase n=1 Tax=Geodermatophilus sabuli TaxID=1564158 RepID=A0A285E976_9ACTN|nr:enoyl-CoA hydratase-related protein [Geodermatophilus sabuli]MBB3082509.1 2-(1,2-epoxy-1,2-dihydrophenyl)acetyl-CoA isomerase [Geodermatophilus sabuli]SNX94621.1 2-(1,2-epoxy-1,2-dihydrophenyl)acetyl-CoA isomerase [Geodermatophilus sabuli]